MNKIAVIIWCAVLSLVGTVSAMAQNAAVSGVVTDANGEPVIGATVLVDGTSQATITGGTGAYTLSGVPAGATITVSLLGYQTVTVSVEGRSQIDIVLESSAEIIEEVMVVAYGTAKKESFTGSAAVVRGSELQKRVVGNVTKSFEGTVSGVQVSSGGGQPGDGASVMIRGMGSINASSSPLYVVDGTPYDGSLSAINPADIESMTVLKDASAGALYGARGANGVIIITTKKGAKDVRVSYKGNVGVASRALERYDLLGMNDYVELSYEALRNSAQYATGMDFESASRFAANNLGQQIGGLKNPEYYNPYKTHSWETLIDQSTGKIRPDAEAAWNESWMDEISNNAALRTEHILSVTGGSERSNYLVSMGYYQEDGILQNTDFSRYTGRVNADTQAKDWFKIGMSANFAHMTSDYQGFSDTSTSNVWYTAQFMAPVYPVYLKDMDGENILDENGELQYEYGQEDDNGYANRPSAQGFNSKAELFNNKAYFQRNSLSARGYVTLGTTREDAKLYGLKLTMNLGTDFNDYQSTSVYNKYHGNAAQEGGRIGKTNTRTLSYTFNQLLTYDRTFGDHSINVLAGHEYYRYRYNYASGQKSGIVEGLDELDPAVTTTGNGSYSDNYAIESILSRVNYGYRGRYYVDASWRTDASSRFHPDARWGHFWSAGASWRVSEESFLKGVDWLHNLTLKAAFGWQGNDNVGTYYAWQGLYSFTWPNGSEPGAFPESLPNENVTWEKNGNFNTGIEASLFRGRLDVTLEYYNRRTPDLLLDNPMPLSTGFQSYNNNIGIMRNRGFEVMFRGTVFDRENFRWNATLMGAFNRNKVLALTGSQDFIDMGIRRIEVGKPINTFYVSKAAGVDPATGKQLYHAYWRNGYDDNGNPEMVRAEEFITDDVSLATPSKYYMGSREPLFSGSVGSNFVIYKNIDLSFLTTYSVGGKLYDGLYYSSMYVQYAGNNWHRNVKRRWQKPGDVTDVPMLEVAGTYAATDNSLIDASYFAIKNVTVGYTLPSRWSEKLDITSLRFYASVDNIAMFNHMDGMDPQYNFSGSVAYSYAPSRVIAVGLDLTF